MFRFCECNASESIVVNLKINNIFIAIYLAEFANKRIAQNPVIPNRIIFKKRLVFQLFLRAMPNTQLPSFLNWSRTGMVKNS